MTWLRARNTAGLPGPPWAWTRRQLARRWNVTPWAVDAAPAYEVELELRLSALEVEWRAAD